MRCRNRSLQCLLVALCFATTGTALAQRGGQGGGRPGGMGGGPMGQGMGEPGGRGGFGGRSGGDFGGMRRDAPAPSNSSNQAKSAGTMHGGLQVGPAGRWWDDKHFAKDLKLRPEQQQRMDLIFEQNRGALLKSYETLKQEESRLDELTHAKTLDESAVNAQIDRVSQARAGLAKANTHFLYQIRNEMDSNQIDRLETHR